MFGHHDQAFHPDPDFDFEIRCVIGAATSGAADIGEVLAAVAGVARHDHEAWFTAWTALGTRVAAAAEAGAESGHQLGASLGYLRAAHYLGVAVNALSALDRADELQPAYRRSRDAWDRFVATTAVDVQSVEIPYEGTELPGYLFRPATPGPHPTLVVVNGSDGSLPSLWATTVFPGLQRGYAVLLFDGPGQQSMLFDHQLPFRPDFEAVLTPVVDHLVTLPDVDPHRLAVYGVSQGGYWVPRALAYEHRFVAAVADPGVVEVASSWQDHLPKSLLSDLDRDRDDKFDHSMALGLKFSPTQARTWAFRARPYGTDGYAQTMHAVRRFTLDQETAALIATPLLITAPENEQFWPGQSQRLADLVGDHATLVPFTAAEGADRHCQPLAHALTAQRVFDWLDDRLS